MPNIDKISKSNYLKRSDVAKPALLTITQVTQEELKSDDGGKETKWIVYFHELEKGMVLNKTNAELIALVTGDRDTDNWTGHKIVLYDDPTVSMGGKLVGGIRVRAPRNQAPPAPAPKPAPRAPAPPAKLDGDFPEDDIPF